MKLLYVTYDIHVHVHVYVPLQTGEWLVEGSHYASDNIETIELKSCFPNGRKLLYMTHDIRVHVYIHVYTSTDMYTYIPLQTGESLVEGSHYASDDIEARVEELFSKWEELLEATDSKRLGLEQALSLLHFNRKVL